MRACRAWSNGGLKEILAWLLFYYGTQRMACENGLSWQNGINVTTNIGQGARTSVPSKNFIPFVSVCNEGAKIPLPCNAWWMLNFTFVVYRHTKSIISTRTKQPYKTRKILGIIRVICIFCITLFNGWLIVRFLLFYGVHNYYS